MNIAVASTAEPVVMKAFDQYFSMEPPQFIDKRKVPLRQISPRYFPHIRPCLDNAPDDEAFMTLYVCVRMAGLFRTIEQLHEHETYLVRLLQHQYNLYQDFLNAISSRSEVFAVS